MRPRGQRSRQHGHDHFDAAARPECTVGRDCGQPVRRLGPPGEAAAPPVRQGVRLRSGHERAALRPTCGVRLAGRHHERIDGRAVLDVIRAVADFLGPVFDVGVAAVPPVRAPRVAHDPSAIGPQGVVPAHQHNRVVRQLVTIIGVVIEDPALVGHERLAHGDGGGDGAVVVNGLLHRIRRRHLQREPVHVVPVVNPVVMRLGTLAGAFAGRVRIIRLQHRP